MSPLSEKLYCLVYSPTGGAPSHLCAIGECTANRQYYLTEEQVFQRVAGRHYEDYEVFELVPTRREFKSVTKWEIV